MKYKHLQSLQLCEDQGIPGKLKKRVRNLVLVILTTYTRPGLSPVVNRNGRGNGGQHSQKSYEEYTV